jgi:hypothetical protein
VAGLECALSGRRQQIDDPHMHFERHPIHGAGIAVGKAGIGGGLDPLRSCSDGSSQG